MQVDPDWKPRCYECEKPPIVYAHLRDTSHYVFLCGEHLQSLGYQEHIDQVFGVQFGVKKLQEIENKYLS